MWRLAAAKWAEIEAKSPDLAPAVALQQRLLGLLVDASASLDGVVSLNLSPLVISDKRTRGVPAVRNETVDIPPQLGEFLPPLCTALAEGGAGDSARHIGEAVAVRSIDAISLLRVSLARDQEAVRTSALHMGFSPDLLWLIGELASSPLAHKLASSVAENGWDRGYCPFCGSWPAYIEAQDAARLLRCSYCALGWSLQSHRCIYCGHAGENFVAAAPDVNQPQRRVELCGACGGYTKVIETAEPTPFPLVAIEDLATMHLDRGAMERGYRRPELVNLDAIEPRATRC
ncbi:MAG: formate dehydrogenase accessory protein FdhE [Vicinamibacterales bacterium]